MLVLPAEQPRRNRVLGQYLGVAAGGWIAGMLWLVVERLPGLALMLLVPCTIVLVLVVRAYRS